VQRYAAFPSVIVARGVLSHGRMRVATTFIVSLFGCAPGLVESPTDLPPDSTGDRVVAPLHGSIVEGDPLAALIEVAGVYHDDERPLAIQLLANPDDPSSWETVASITATTPIEDGFSFTTQIRPSGTQWPTGGVLRLRVIDDAGTPLPHEIDGDTVIALANSIGRPPGWLFLVEQPVGSIDETAAYYQAIDAPPTLTEFQTRFGFPGDETVAIYYNAGDLGIGRDMHCRATEGGGLACYVRNFGQFGGDRADAITLTVAGDAPFATVAMAYTPPIDAPNAVQFMVYGGDGALINRAQLDTRGDNASIPQNCLNCHGGRSSYDAATSTVRGAHFLPFDPAAFDYADRPDLTLAAQEGAFRRLDELVLTAAPTPAVTEWVDGMFPADAPYDPAFVPAGWNASPRDARVYREVVAPFCRGCHTTFNDAGAFTTAEQFRANGALIVNKVCTPGPRGMPAAEITTNGFYASNARALLLTWLDRPGACAPR
jgi:hypothetical protein